jgi:pimeloyl-ACP methyl ester carboxylesterase
MKLPPRLPPASWNTSLTSAPRETSSSRAASMSSTARSRLSIEPGWADVTPLPKMIEAFDPGGENVGHAVQAVADHVRSVVIPGTGYFVTEEAPEEMLAELTAFLAPYRDAAAAAHDPGLHAPAASRR